MIRNHGNLPRPDFRFSHIDRRLRHFPVTDLHADRLDSSQRLDSHGGFVCQAVVIDIFGDTADPVAAHLTFGAVHIVHGHTEIRLFRRADKDQAVTADPEMITAHVDRHRLRVRNGGFRTIHIDIIIAATVHFGKIEFHRYLVLLYLYSIYCIYTP